MIPPGVDPDLADQLAREAVEQYFENQWIHRPRHGLDDRSPLARRPRASRGDAVARAKLTAVVRLREQLGNRPSAVSFTRAIPSTGCGGDSGWSWSIPSAVDLAGSGLRKRRRAGSARPVDAGRLALLEAFTSAAGLRDDARTARLAAELLARRPACAGLARTDFGGRAARAARHGPR